MDGQKLAALNRRQDRYDLWGDVWGGVLLLGIIVALGWDVYSDRPALEKCVSIVSEVLIGLGILGELRCAHRSKMLGDILQAEAEARVAEANQKAESLQLETVRLQMAMQPRDIVLLNRNGDEKVRTERFAEVRQYAGTKALIQAVPDFEAQRLAELIQNALIQSGGWDVRSIHDIPMGRIREGVRIVTIEESDPPISSVKQAATAINALLQLDLGEPYGPPYGGIMWSPQPAVIAKTFFEFDIPDDTVLIMVGMKPIRWAYMWPATSPTSAKTEK